MTRVTLAAILLSSLIFVGCDERSQMPSKAEELLGGEHKLHKMMESTDVSSKTSAGFFLVFGEVSSTTKSSVLVKFAWQMNDGSYAISSLPMEKIRVKFDDTIVVPTVKFRWRRWPYINTPTTQRLMDEYVLYALVTVKNGDWPPKVVLPLN